MLSKSNIQFIKSLNIKKNRDREGLFIAEGDKLVSALLRSKLELYHIYRTQTWNRKKHEKLSFNESVIEEQDIKKLSLLKSPPDVIGIFKIPTFQYTPKDIKLKLSILLDGIQDPGNLGTIIRLAEWFGIENIFCSSLTVNVFNPKVVQASMGAVANVKIHYVDLAKLILDHKSDTFEIYGTDLKNAENIYQTQLTNKGFIILGNEGNGINQNLKKLLSKKLLIPSFNKNRISESLNVSIAAAIICNEMMKRNN